jgi:hypothetical protein
MVINNYGFKIIKIQVVRTYNLDLVQKGKEKEKS